MLAKKSQDEENLKALIYPLYRSDSDKFPIQYMLCDKERRCRGQIRVILPCIFRHGWVEVHHIEHPGYVVQGLPLLVII